MGKNLIKRHESFHIENLTDLNAFKKEANERLKKGESTIIHLHARSIDCKEQEHIRYDAEEMTR